MTNVLPFRPRPPPPSLDDWRDRLDYKQTRQGDKEILHTKANATTLLRNDPGWRAVLAWDELSQAIVCREPPPWYTDARCVDDSDGTFDRLRPWDDDDACRVQNWLQRKWSLTVSEGTAYKAAVLVAKGHRFDPLREWLLSLSWDGVPRVESWLHRYLGAEDGAYARLIGRAFLVGSVARGLKPGVKMDTMLILEGAQGLFKSQSVKRLYGPDWFRESPIDLRSNDRFLSVRGCWCREWPELDGLGKADAGRVKSFLSPEADDFRAPYARNMVHAPRRCVFVATVNPPQLGYLIDESGNRRMWPVECGKTHAIDLDAIDRDRPQIWAEAVMMYARGEKHWPVTREEHRICNQEQEVRMVAEVWLGKISMWLDDTTRGETVTIRQVLTDCLAIPMERQERGNATRAGSCLARLGWHPIGQRGHDRERHYARTVEEVDVERAGIQELQ